MLDDIKRRLLNREITLAEAIERVRTEAVNQLTDIRLRWLESELNGYPARKKVLEESSLHEPEYRKLQGRYLAQLSTGEWVDVSDTNLGDYPGFLGVGIATIEDVVRSKGNQEIDLPLGEIIPGTPFRLRIHRDQLSNIDESVRSRLIDLIDEIQSDAPDK